MDVGSAHQLRGPKVFLWHTDSQPIKTSRYPKKTFFNCFVTFQESEPTCLSHFHHCLLISDENSRCQISSNNLGRQHCIEDLFRIELSQRRRSGEISNLITFTIISNHCYPLLEFLVLTNRHPNKVVRILLFRYRQLRPVDFNPHFKMRSLR